MRTLSASPRTPPRPSRTSSPPQCTCWNRLRRVTRPPPSRARGAACWSPHRRPRSRPSRGRNCAGWATAADRNTGTRDDAGHGEAGVDLGLQDRVYLMAGGSRGLGYAAAEALVAEGARVVVSGRDAGAAAGAAQALGSGRAVGLAADNADPATPGRLIAAARQEFGRLDGALISVGGPPPGSATDVPDEAWEAAFGSGFLGAVGLRRALAAELTEGGAIAFVLSSSVRVPIPGLAISNGLRPGLAGFAKTLANELGPRGIRVNGLLPGWIATDRMRELGPDREELADSIPLRRIGRPAEFGRLAAVVLSPAASYLTGVMLPVDGGALRVI